MLSRHLRFESSVVFNRYQTGKRQHNKEERFESSVITAKFSKNEFLAF